MTDYSLKLVKIFPDPVLDQVGVANDIGRVCGQDGDGPVRWRRRARG